MEVSPKLMTETIKTVLTSAVDRASREAGLVMLSAEAGTDFNNQPTARLRLQQARPAAGDDFASQGGFKAPAQSAPGRIRHASRIASQLLRVSLAVPPLHFRFGHPHRPRRGSP